MSPFVQTVLGRVEPSDLGFTLPHEHTQCQLWTIPERFDYWELTADEDLVAGRAGAVPGRRRDLPRRRDAARDRPEPGWLRRARPAHGPPRRHGHGLVPRALLPARGAHRPAQRGRAGRGHDPRVRGRGAGSEDADGPVRPGIIGEIGTHKPWVSAQEERVFRACGRAARATGMAVITHAVMSPVGLRQLEILEEAGADPARVVIGHADSYPVLEHWLAHRRAGRLDRVRLPRDVASRRWSAAASRGVIELILRAARPGPRRPDPALPGRLRQQPARLLRRERVHVPPGGVPAAAPRAGRRRGRDPPDHGGEPAADPGHRGVGGKGRGTPRRVAASTWPRAGGRLSRRGLPLERGLDGEGHVALERLADRAAVLGRLCELGEGGRVDARNLPAHGRGPTRQPSSPPRASQT